MTRGAARVIPSLVDLSLYVDNLMAGYVAAIVQTERGPLWEPTPVTSWDEFERIFGRLYSGSADPLVLKVGLQQGAQFIVIRIANCTDPSDVTSCTASKASLVLQDRGDIPIPGSITSIRGPFNITAASGGSATGIEVENFTFLSDSSDKLLLAVGSGDDQEVTLTGVNATAAQVAASINAGTTGITASAVAGKVRLVANNSANTLYVKTITHDAYSVLGLSVGNYAPTEGTDSLVVSVDGGSDQTFTLTAGTRTASQIASELSTLTGANVTVANSGLTITSNTVGDDSSIQILSTSTADTVLGFDNDEHSGSEDTIADTLKIEAANEGAWGNDLRIAVFDNDLNPADRFDIRVSYLRQGGLNEYFSNLSMDSESDFYVVNYINLRSRLIRAVDLNSPNNAAVARPLGDAIGTALTGGDDGEALTTADYIGDELAQTGIYSLDKTDLAIDVIVPGTTSITVLQALTAYNEDRGSWVAYMDTPAGLDPTEVRKWRMGEDPYSHEAFNSHRLTLWFGRPLVYNSQFDRREYISNLGHLAACLSKATKRYDYSVAPVGPKRGTVDFVEGLDFNMAQYRGYQDMAADYGINSLIITKQQGIEGAVFWEQYTTQRAASALRDLNVVRFCTYVIKSLLPALRMFLFDPNHPVTWREIHRTLEPSFQLWKAKFNIYWYYLQTDRDAYFDVDGTLKNAVLNTGLEIDQGTYRCRVLVQPVRAIRYLEFEMGIMRTGESSVNYRELKTLPGWVKL